MFTLFRNAPWQFKASSKMLMTVFEETVLEIKTNWWQDTKLWGEGIILFQHSIVQLQLFLMG